MEFLDYCEKRYTADIVSIKKGFGSENKKKTCAKIYPTGFFSFKYRALQGI